MISSSTGDTGQDVCLVVSSTSWGCTFSHFRILNRIRYQFKKIEKSHWYGIYKRRIIYWIYPASANQGGIKRWITRLSSSRMILYIERFTTSACSFYIWIVEYKTWFKLIWTIVHFSSKKCHLCFHINYDRDTLLSDLKNKILFWVKVKTSLPVLQTWAWNQALHIPEYKPCHCNPLFSTLFESTYCLLQRPFPKNDKIKRR